VTESLLAKHYFVDEAGDLTLFDKSGRVIVGREGVSHCFYVGLVDLPDPLAAHGAIEDLRKNLLGDPYFRGIPSMQPDARKTAIAFHAKDDLPEVRREVFRLLPSLGGRVIVAFRRKSLLADEARAQYEATGQKLAVDRVYDDLVARVFQGKLHTADTNNIVFARRGKSDRNESLTTAIERARTSHIRRWKQSDVRRPTNIKSAVPSQSVGLQVIDYYLWALQRMVERREDRFFAMLSSQYRLIMDLDDRRERGYGAWYRDNAPLTLEKMKPVISG
jgi:hypothetical protein